MAPPRINRTQTPGVNFQQEPDPTVPVEATSVPSRPQHEFTTAQPTVLPNVPAAPLNHDGMTVLAHQLQNGKEPVLKNGELGPPLSPQDIQKLLDQARERSDASFSFQAIPAGASLEELAVIFDTSVQELVKYNPELPLADGRLSEDVTLRIPERDVPERKKPAPVRIIERGEKAYSIPAPTFKDVLEGASMHRGMGGASVKELQQKLNALGIQPPLAVDGKFGPKTEAALKKFQCANGLQQTGVLGAVSAAKMAEENCARIPEENTGAPFFSNADLAAMAERGDMGKAIGQKAAQVANSMRSYGACAKGVNDVLISLGVDNQRGHAYQKAEQLEKNPRFTEINVESSQLSQLPPGAVVVWGRSSAKPYGHVSVALGDGREASDHIQRQIEGGRYGTDFGQGPDAYGRKFRVFLPS